MIEEFTWNGTGLKYAVNMTCDGFDMNEDDWTVTVVRGNNKIVFDRENSIQDEEDQWYICIESELLGPGLINIIFDASVPDGDFVSGIRHEIQKYELIINRSL